MFHLPQPAPFILISSDRPGSDSHFGPRAAAQDIGASDYSMRIWLRPDKLAQYNLTPGDIAAAIREQNAQFAAGRFGEEPQKNPATFTYSVTTQGRFADPREFENIIIRSDEFGGALRVKDIARVELGALNYSFSATFNGAPTVPIGVYLQPGAKRNQPSSG
jgi:multidrug efflux pump